MNNREAGALLHITSLPNRYGVGDLGEAAFNYIDFLEDSSLSYWQILPTGITGVGDSPYQSISAFAGNPIFISIEKLIESGLLKEEIKNISKKMNYNEVLNFKEALLREAFENFKRLDESLKWECYNFCDSQGYWIDNYALFKALKDKYSGKSWVEWATPLRDFKKSAIDDIKYKIGDDIYYHKFVQYLYFKQFKEVKDYANSKGIKIIGDIPIFVAYDSSDVWSNQELFLLGSDKLPYAVAGVPPDYFSETGQLWGNPLYNWDRMKQDEYWWWRERFSVLLSQVDLIRLDHFRGFEAYWSVPASEKTAINGKWVDGPKFHFFDTLLKHFKELPIIAEDLGVITQGVEELRDKYSFPGMKIVQFAFSDEKNSFLSHNYVTNSIVYTGTHDNDTTLGWFLDKENEKSVKFAKNYIDFNKDNIVWKFIEYSFASVSKIAIIPMQDFLELDSSTRMNTPGTSIGNWGWSLEKIPSKKLSNKISKLVKKYNR